jgi:hypothetical protein
LLEGLGVVWLGLALVEVYSFFAEEEALALELYGVSLETKARTMKSIHPLHHVEHIVLEEPFSQGETFCLQYGSGEHLKSGHDSCWHWQREGSRIV